MSTKHPDTFASLAAPFDPREVKARTQGGKQLHYVTARTVMNRLDRVLGPENWWDRYREWGDSLICELTIRLPDGQELTKEDAGGAAGMADAGDDDKSIISDAFKRAAVKFGVGRYLYRDGVASFDAPAVEPEPEPRPAPPATNGHANGHHKARRDWPAAHAPEPTPTAPTNGNGKGKGQGQDPTSGKALFAWVKDQEQRYEVGILKYLSSWGKLQDFPGRMVEWDADAVGLAVAEVRRKLASIESQEVPS